MVKVTIYTHKHTMRTHTRSHFTVIRLYTQVSVSSFLSGFTGDRLPVSHSLSHTQTEANWGDEWGSGWCRCSYTVTVKTWVLFFLVFEAQSRHLASKGNCRKVGPPVKRSFFTFSFSPLRGVA